ncbi:Asp-tRNA(Asn)/Glu-tRNA(Gln) amidotransferase subunit GatC [Clostridium fermenticellae]|uniref:Aspartyl/glutamyl-tRNA(Asn/Gln) amidotransferase subunit C n=1 Tax=Clostridium fermenticellae TaxID=2068654 RepID=A0A386H4B7_9CLOT|nr:Asp-tRNA(Asn)/Glu-tRNA(Gln) amidotransferase subunit GatC [Clostridium fermenticellae]AYD40520.1 Asp-tRNA(Asn)/Glu-tRNA(Gln) amidotransferase subunit GatC [Clostridium fermenticellae]
MVSVNEVKYIAKLAKLKFKDEEAQKMAKEFEAILGYFKTIDKFDLNDVNLNKYDDDLESVVREDKVKVFNDKEKLFSNIKSRRETYIEVPKIIE